MENDLKKRAKKHLKKQKGISPFSSFNDNAGDETINTQAFNNAMGASCGGGGACEGMSVSDALSTLDRLDETSSEAKAKRLFLHPSVMEYIKTFAIFTAYNPDAKQQPKAVNKRLQKHLKADLSYGTPRFIEKNESDFTIEDIEKAVIDGHWHYYKTKGVYFNVEQSLLVYNITLDEAKSLCEKYHQQSFVFGKNDNGVLKFEFYANRSRNGHSYIKVDEREDFKIVGADADNLYTQIARDFKINIPFEVFEVAAENMVESINKKNALLKWSKDSILNCIAESVNESLTGKRRYFMRTTLWYTK